LILSLLFFSAARFWNVIHNNIQLLERLMQVSRLLSLCFDAEIHAPVIHYGPRIAISCLWKMSKIMQHRFATIFRYFSWHIRFRARSRMRRLRSGEKNSATFIRNREKIRSDSQDCRFIQITPGTISRPLKSVGSICVSFAFRTFFFYFPFTTNTRYLPPTGKSSFTQLH